MEANRAKDLVSSLGAQADLHGLDSLSEEERSVLVPYWARGVIGNGGFRYFYEGNHDLHDVARRMRTLQLDAAATACESVAQHVFAGGAVPRNDDEREALLSKVDWKRFSQEEDVVFDLRWEDILDAVGRYVEAHPAAFKAAMLEGPR